MRWSAFAIVCALGGAARADTGGEVAIGGGVHAGDAMTAVDARAGWERDGGGAAIGLGVRVRAIGDGVYRAGRGRAMPESCPVGACD